METLGAAPGSEGRPPVRIGLGYVAEVAEADATAVVAERGRGGPYADVADLAARSGASRGALVRCAWAGALDTLAGARGAAYELGELRVEGDARRAALWQAGAASRAGRVEPGTQLALPLGGSPTPELPDLEPWERMVADYRATGMTIGTHPMEIMRPGLDSAALSSDALERTRDGTGVLVAGMVVARQRPATAKGIVFMLLEDEHGTINLIVPPPVVERCRLAVRTAGFVRARGRLEHREGTTNVLVASIERLERPAEVTAPPAPRLGPPVSPVRPDAELAAALPPAHSWGRRGR